MVLVLYPEFQTSSSGGFAVRMSDEDNSSCSSESSFYDDENMPLSTIKPYQFEPEFSSSEEREEEEEEDSAEHENSRTGNSDW